MAVAVISAQRVTNSSSINFVQGNSNVIVFCFQNANDTSTPPTYNGVAFSYRAQVGTHGSAVFCWYMQNPPDGSHTFVHNGFSYADTPVYSFSGVANSFMDVEVVDMGDVVNSGVTLGPSMDSGYLLFYQGAASGSGALTPTAGQANVYGIQLGSAMTHASPGAGNSYHSTVSYSPSFGSYDQYGIALTPYIYPSVSPSASPSVSPSASVSPSVSPSQSPSASKSASVSPSQSPSASKSSSVSPSASPSQSPSASVSPSQSPSTSISPSQSPSASVSPSISPSVSPSPVVPNLVTKGTTTFTVGDILRIKDGINDEWMRVVDVFNSSHYFVSRDLAGNYSVGTYPTWTKGATIVNYKGATDGSILLTSSLTNAPYIDIATNGTTPWNGTTSQARIGNLAGITDANFGTLSGYGIYTTNGYFTGKIQGTTIIGGTLETSSGTGQRVVIASPDNTITFYNDSNAVISQMGGGTGVGAAFRAVLDSSTITGLQVISAQSSGEGIRIQTSNGARGILLENTSSVESLYIYSTAGESIYINHSANFKAIELLNSGNSNALYVSNSGSYTAPTAYFIGNQTGADLTSGTVQIARGTPGTSLYINQSVNTSNNIAGISINMVNAGSGKMHAFAIDGAAYVASGVGGSQSAKIRVFVGGGTYYIPCYES